jgi:hypothetical protein
MPAARASQVAFTTVVVVAMCSFLLLIQGFFGWTWIFPWAATAVSVTAYFRGRGATVPKQGLAWGLTQVVFGIGAIFLVVVPAMVHR